MADDRGGKRNRVWFVIAEIAMPIITVLLIPLVGMLGSTLLNMRDCIAQNGNEIEKVQVEVARIYRDGTARLQAHLIETEREQAQFEQVQKDVTGIRSDQKAMNEKLTEMLLMQRDLLAEIQHIKEEPR